MNGNKLELGTPIDSWCTHCKTDQPHVVATLKTDGTINKVQCNACQAIHVYRKPKTEPAGGSKKASGSTKRRKRPDGAVSDAEASKAKAYAMESSYQVGDVIEHSKFLFGRVVALKPGGKMEVAFGDTTRILVCKDVGLLSARRSSRSAPAPPPPPKPVEVEEVEGVEDAEVEADEVVDAAEDE
jgi:hypothetical protein